MRSRVVSRGGNARSSCAPSLHWVLFLCLAPSWQLSAQIIVRECPPVNPGTPIVQTDHSVASLEVEIFGNPPEALQAAGDVTTRVVASRVGTIQTEMLAMSLVGDSSAGPFSIRLQPNRPTVGAGTVDPTTNTIDSFFDVFVDISIVPGPGQPAIKLSNLQQPVRVEIKGGCIDHAAGPTRATQVPGDVTLFAATGQPVGVVRRVVHSIGEPPPPPPCFPPRGRDIMNSTLLHDIDIVGIGLCRANLAGPVTVERSDPYIDPATGLTCIDTKIVELLLQGVDPVCGRICITLNPFKESRGQICEKVKGTCFPANSWFNVFMKVELKDLGLCLYACSPARMECCISAIPPFGCLYNLNIGDGAGPVPLYRGPCAPVAVGGDPCAVDPLPPPIAYIIKAVHQPLPPKVCECFPPAGEDAMVTTLIHQIDIPGLQLSCSNFTGPMVVRRSDPYLDASGNCCIKTEIVHLEMQGTCSNGAPATIRLCPRRPSTGLICGLTPGKCFPALSCFDIFFEIEVQTDAGPVVFKNCDPARMCCQISALPPLGCSYAIQNAPLGLFRVPQGADPLAICSAVPALAPDGFVRNAVHRPDDPTAPCCPEYGPGKDTLKTQLLHDIEIPGIGLCKANLSGPVTVERGLPYKDPTTGLCCVETVMTSMNLQGVDPLCGRICITLDPRRPSKGRICSKQPTACFPANSCFEMFVRVELKDLGKVFVACVPASMCCMIDSIPPFKCLYQLNLGTQNVVPLYDEIPGADVCAISPQPNPAAFIIKAVHVPSPPCDCFPPAGKDEMQTELSHRIRVFGAAPNGGDLLCDADMIGPMTVERSAPYVDPITALCCIDTEIIQMELRGNDPVCGEVILRLCPDVPSKGKICQMPGMDGCFPAASFFDVFIEVEIPSLGIRLKNCAPTRMECKIDAIPPYNCVYQLNLTNVPLYRAGECARLPNPNLRPTAVIEAARHVPRFPCDCPYGPGVDVMDSTLSHDIDLLGMGKICRAPLRGRVKVERGIPYQTADGLCCVSTRMVELDLKGTDPVCGEVRISLCPDQPSRGTICQMMAGACFPALSCFEVHVRVEVMGMVLKTCQPALMCCKINTVPPFDCTYQLDLGSTVLLFREGTCNDPAAQPVAAIRQATHTPKPCGPVSIRCDVRPDGSVGYVIAEDPNCPCEGNVVITRSVDGGPAVVLSDVVAGAGGGVAPLPVDVPCRGLPDGVHTVTYCAQCVRPDGTSSVPVCCTVTVKCGDEPPPDCLTGVACRVVDGWVLLDIASDPTLPNCDCARIEVLRGGVRLGVFPFGPSVDLGACEPGELCVRCVRQDGTLGPLHCCRIDRCEPPKGGSQRPGDCNQDGNTDLSDAVCLFGHLFLGRPAVLPCGDGAPGHPANTTLVDSNGDGRSDLSDGVHVLLHLFSTGGPPVLGKECILIPNCPDACVR